MKTYAALRIYSLLLQKLDGKTFPAASDLLHFFEEQGFPMSKRTFERHLANLRAEFGIDIMYERSQAGYFAEYNAGSDRETLVRLLDLVEQAAVFSEAIQKDNDVLQYIDFSRNERLRGLNWIKTIVSAVRRQRILDIGYHRFGSDKPETIRLKPLLLKQYEDRWYVVGLVDKKGAERIYALDRITACNVQPERFTPPKGLNIKEKFRHTIGINYSDNVPERVVIKVDAEQANYIRTLPLHASQQLISSTSDSETISLNVVVNFELRQRIMMLGAAAEVLEPDGLRSWIKEEFSAGLSRYSNL